MAERMHAVGRRAASLPPLMWKHFMQDRVLLSAGSLAFQTLLSIVPMMAVILSILKVFPVFSSIKRSIEDLLFQNFDPAQGALLKGYLWEFIDKTATVPTLGGIFLFVMVLFLISTIDHTLNGIWEVQAPRKPIEGFTLYWTVLTLGPALIGTSLAASSYVWYTVFTQGPLLEMRTRILSYIPVFNSVLAFSLLYMLVPNRKVRFLHAAAGGVLAALLFELAKRWFTFYVTNFATYQHIYGALSVFPMLFFWIYLEWVVVLTGAEFVFSLGTLESPSVEKGEFDPLRGVPGIIAVLRHVWAGELSGTFMTMKKLFTAENIPDRRKLSRIVDFLLQCKLIHLTADGGFALSADLRSRTLYDLYTMIPPELAQGDDGTVQEAFSTEFDGVRDGVRDALRSGMHMPLTALVNDSR